MSNAVAVAVIGQIARVRDPVFVESISDLRALGQLDKWLCFVTGAFSETPESATTGWFKLDYDDTTSADDGMDTIIDVNSKRWKRLNTNIAMIVEYTEAAEAAAAAAVPAAAIAESAAAAAIYAYEALGMDVPLAYHYETAYSIDGTTDDIDTAVTVKEGDVVTQSSIYENFNLSWADSVMRVIEDGTVAWADHNLILESGNLGAINYFANGCTKLVAQEGPEAGVLDAVKLTVNASPSSLDVTLNGAKIVNFNGNYFLNAWKVKYDGTHRWVYLQVDSPGALRVYFDLQNGVVGTADVGVVGVISQFDELGNPLPDGWYYIYAYQVVAAASYIFKFGVSDANASTVVTIGKTITIARPQSCYGVKPLMYLETGALAKYGAPYSWESGIRTFMVSGGGTYNCLWSEDLTRAPWVKTGCTPLFTSVGISGEPCSRLTATAPNATCLQAVVSAGALQTFQVYVRRLVGVGPISISMDNGATWTPITADINSITYTKVYLHGTVANPTVGFKIDTNGDAIEVCHANNIPAKYVQPPLTVWGVARVMGPVVVPNTNLPISLAGSNVLAYYDADLINDTAVLSPSIWSGFSMNGATSGHSVTVGETFNVNDGVNLGFPHGVSSPYEILAASEVGQRIEATIYLAGKAGGSYCSINGEPPSVNHVRNLPTLDRFTLGSNGGEMQFVRKLLIAPTSLSNRDMVRTKHYSSGIKNNLYAFAIVAGDHEFEPYDGGTDMERIPAVEVVKEYGDKVMLGVFWAGRDKIHPWNTELPSRVMQRNYVYDKVENTLTPVTNAEIVHQPSRWSAHLGATYAGLVIRVPSGPHEGRLICLTQQEDSVSGTLVDMHSNLYVQTNDRSDCHPDGWTTASMIFDSWIHLGSTFIQPSPGGDYVILPADHPVAPNRIVVTCYGDANRVFSVYSDDWGITWSLGTVLAVGAGGATETTTTIWPDGTLVMTIRPSSGAANARKWLISVDGGVTWVLQGLIPAILDCDSSASTTQLDPSGVTGTYGRIALSHATFGFRQGFQIGFATDNTMELRDPMEPWEQRRYFGYSRILSLFGGEYMACAVEYGHASSNLDNSIGLAILKTPAP
jgi:hypothetical protein